MTEKQHPYCYPGTDVLINRLDIRDTAILEQFERLESGMRLEFLPSNIPVSPEGLKAIHRHILEEVYDWAGEYRTVNTGRGAPFCKADYIDAEVNKRFATINAEDNLRGLDPLRFSERLAEHLNELNAIHPFLDGNGRTQRAFLEIVATQAGHEIDLARINPKAWNRASIEGFRKQDHAPMCAVIAGTILTPQQQRQRQEDQQRSASSLSPRSERIADQADSQSQNQIERQAAQERTATRDPAEGGHDRARDKDGGRGGGRGGRGR